MNTTSLIYDFVIIGSGFGGSVSALRLSEKGYKVLPTTAHILGGARMGKTKEEGVINAHNEVFGYKNMLICDGSMISANSGVHPSLSITAITEHTMSKISPKPTNS